LAKILRQSCAKAAKISQNEVKGKRPFYTVERSACVLLEVENLATHFVGTHGLTQAVRGVSFTLSEGETLALVGESGCGKSVTALSLLRLVPPPGKIVSGVIRFEGTDLSKLSEKEMRQVRGNRIAMIFQEPTTSLNPVLTIGDQITEVLRLHLKQNAKEAHEEAEDLLHQVGVPAASRRLRLPEIRGVRFRCCGGPSAGEECERAGGGCKRGEVGGVRGPRPRAANGSVIVHAAIILKSAGEFKRGSLRWMECAFRAPPSVSAPCAIVLRTNCLWFAAPNVRTAVPKRESIHLRSHS